MSITLNTIAKLKTNSRKRIGRGIGSGTGKTCGRGVKGQKARTGSAMKGFEGGQTPIYMRIPKKGFSNYCKKEYQVINLADFLFLAEKNKIDPSVVVTKEKLLDLGLIDNKNSKVKLIMSDEGESSINFKFQVDLYSKKARSLSS